MKIIKTKITLEKCNPKVTRELEVPVQLRLDYFHDTIQSAMGWEDWHAHVFQIGKKTWQVPRYGEVHFLDACEYSLADILAMDVKKLRYIYDLGDHWEHRFKFGTPTDAVEGEVYPKLISGTGACPIEDCGGVGGYAQLLEELAKPAKEQDEDIMDWFPEDFDPEKFDLKKYQKDIQRLAEAINDSDHAIVKA